MIVTITHFNKLQTTEDGQLVPLGGGFLAGQTLTGAGTATAAPSGASLVRVATDTAITVTAYGTHALYMPAGSVEFFPIRAGKQLEVATA